MVQLHWCLTSTIYFPWHLRISYINTQMRQVDNGVYRSSSYRHILNMKLSGSSGKCRIEPRINSSWHHPKFSLLSCWPMQPSILCSFLLLWKGPFPHVPPYQLRQLREQCECVYLVAWLNVAGFKLFCFILGLRLFCHRARLLFWPHPWLAWLE